MIRVRKHLRLHVTKQKATSVYQDAAESEKTGNVWAKLRTLAGSYDGPEDWSVEHDHYLYGTPRKAHEEEN